MVRKKGKLPGKTARYTYDLEYGSDTIEIQEDAISRGSGSSCSTICWRPAAPCRRPSSSYVSAAGTVAAAACIIELAFLEGREKLDVPFTSMISYDT